MKVFFAVIFICFVSFVYSQKGTTSVGLQIKPIFPVSFLGTGKIASDFQGVHFETKLQSGYSAGILVRHKFTDLLAFESGISYVKRKYKLSISEGTFSGDSYFRIISYEIPAVLMVYVQASEKFYLNGSLGPVLDMFPSSIQTTDYYFKHTGFRNHILQPAVSGNVGFEYRTEKSGAIYLGASYQRPFTYIFLSGINYKNNGKDIVVYNELLGSYLTIDLRYYFPDEKRRKKAHINYE